MALRVSFLGRSLRPALGLRAAALLLPLTLAGCGAVEGIGGKMLLAGTEPKEMDPKLYASTPVCPNIEIREGTEFMPILESGKTASPEAVVRFQANVQRVARDCDESGGGIRVRVGAAGRVLSGPKGATGAVTIPVRVVALVGDKVLYSKLVPTTVDVQAPDFSALWSVVDDGLVLSVADSHEATIYVGLDGKGDVRAPKPSKARKPTTKD